MLNMCTYVNSVREKQAMKQQFIHVVTSDKNN